MNFENNNKHLYVIAGVASVVLITVVVLLLSTNTSLLRGLTLFEKSTTTSVSKEVALKERAASDARDTLSKVIEKLGEAQSLLDELIDLSDRGERYGYENIETVLTNTESNSDKVKDITEQLATIRDVNHDNLTDEEKAALELQLQDMLTTLKNVLVQSNQYKEALVTFDSELVICPISENNSDALQFRSNHSSISSIVDDLNYGDFYTEQDVEDIKSLVVFMSATLDAESENNCMDYSGFDDATLDELEVDVFDSFFEGKSLTEIINFANQTMDSYNSGPVQCYMNLSCTEIEYLSNNLDSKAVCLEGEVYDPDTDTCGVPMCPVDDLYSEFDMIYKILGNYTDTPEEFSGVGQGLFDDALDNVIEELNKNAITNIIGDYKVSFDYESDANGFIDIMNQYVEANNDEVCNGKTYELLSIETTGDGDNEFPGSDDEESEESSELSCPADSQYISEFDVCVCPNESVVSPGEECTDSDEDEENESSFYTCSSGLIVEDPLDCPAEEEDDEEEFAFEGDEETEDFFGSAPDENEDFGLDSNTDVNVVQSPQIQGDTGSEAILLLLTIFVLGFNVIIWSR